MISSLLLGILIGILIAYLVPIYYIYNLPKQKNDRLLTSNEVNNQVLLNILTCSCFVNNSPCTVQLHKSILIMTSMHRSIDISNAHIYYHTDMLIIQSSELISLKFLNQEELWCWYMALIERSNQYKNSQSQKLFLKCFAHTSMIDPTFENKDTIFNLLVARQFIAYTTSKTFKERQLSYLSDKFNSRMKSDYFQNIKITHLEYADPPKFQELKVIGLEEDGTILIDGQFEYSGLSMILDITVNLKVPGFNYFTNPTSTKESNDVSHNSGFLLNVSFNFTLKKLAGKLLIKFPQLPINHFYYGFYSDTIFEVSVEPRVSNRQVKIGLLGSLLEKRILEVFRESMVLPKMEYRNVFPLDLVFDSPATPEILEKLNSPKTDLARRKSVAYSVAPSSIPRADDLNVATSVSQQIRHHSSTPSIDKKNEPDQPIQQDIVRSPEVNNIITEMFGSEPSEIHLKEVPKDVAKEVPKEEHEPATTEEKAPLEKEISQSRFAKLGVGSNLGLIARKVQKTIVSTKESFTTPAPQALPPVAPPVPSRTNTTLLPSSSVEDLSGNNKMRRLGDNINKYLDDYSKQHVQLKSDLSDEQHKEQNKEHYVIHKDENPLTSLHDLLDPLHSVNNSISALDESATEHVNLKEHTNIKEHTHVHSE